MGLWTPASIATSLWLDASDPNTVLPFNPPYVGVWVDAAGGLGSASQMDGSRQPELLAAQQNGLDVLAFDGIDDYFDTDQLTSLAADLAGMTIFAAGADLGGGPVLVASTAGSATEARAALIHGAGYQPTASGRRLDTDTAQSVSIQSTSGWGISMARFDWEGATLSVGVNGLVTALAGAFQTAGSSDAAASLAVTVGGWTSGATLAGQLGELVVVPWAVNSALRQIIEGYLAHKWGVADDLPADHPYKATAPPDTASYMVAVRGELEQQWGDALPVRGELMQSWGIKTGAELVQLWSDAPQARGALDQAWAIMGDAARGELEQQWGIKTGAELVQPWGDAPQARAVLYQPWSDAVAVRAMLIQRWAETIVARGELMQPWAILANARGELMQPWAILADGARGLLDQAWDIRDTHTARGELRQVWSLASDDSVMRYTIAVSLAGRSVHPLSVNIEGDRDEDSLSCELILAVEVEYLAASAGATLVVTITSLEATEEFVFVVTALRITEGFGSVQYTIEALSPGALMGSPYASGMIGPMAGLASTIAGTLVSGCGWLTADGEIKEGTLAAAGETPLELLRRFAAAVGAVVQSRRDGSMVVEPYYLVPLSQWADAQPGRVLVENVDCYSVGSTFDPRPGWNRYAVSDQVPSGGRITLELIDISSGIKECRGYETPWTGAFSLAHTGGSWVSIAYLGVEERSVEEMVEFVGGGGSTQYPVHGISSCVWMRADLGTVTPDEDSLMAQVAGESLALVTYTTRCKRWLIRDERSEQLQLVAEI